MRPPAEIEATRIEFASIWQPNEVRTWLRWVLAREWDVCSRNFSNSGLTIVLPVDSDFAEANRMVFWDDSGSFVNLFFLETFSSFLSSEYFSR